MSTVSLPAQELEQLISSKLKVNNEQDFQIMGSNTYRLNGKLLYQTPNTVRLFENNAYRFDINFSYFGDKVIIDADNYTSRACGLQAPATSSAQYRIRDIDPNDGIVSVEAIAIGQAGTKDTLNLQLWDKNTDKMLADVIFPIEVQADDPSTNTTAYLPMEMRYQPLFITLEDIDNPNNRVERQLLPFFPDTINVDAKDVFNLLTEIEQEVYLNDQAYILVADYEKDYGYQANFAWEGQGLQYKPASDNQLKSYLTVVPGRDRPVVSTPNMEKLLADNLRKAGLDRKGSRVQQEISLVMPKAEVKKVYPVAYLNKNPGLSSSRLDHQTIAKIVDNNRSKLDNTYLNNGNIKLITGVKLYDAGRLKMQQQPRINQVDPSRTKAQPSTTQPTRTTPQKMQMQRSRINTTESTVKPKEPAKNYAVTHTQVRVLPADTKPNPYYTLSIEISRKTDPMSFQTYLLTFRVIE
jgi:hypothetical protein